MGKVCLVVAIGCCNNGLHLERVEILLPHPWLVTSSDGILKARIAVKIYRDPE